MNSEQSFFSRPNAFGECRKSAKVFKDFFNSSYQPVYYFAMELVSNKARAEEIVADSFLSIWQLEEDPGSLEHLRSLLYLLTRNACYSYLRRAGKLSESKAKELYSLNNWEDEFVNRVVESELLNRVSQDKSARRI